MKQIRWIAPMLLAFSAGALAQPESMSPWQFEAYAVSGGDGDVERGGEVSEQQFGASVGYRYNLGRGRMAGVNVAVDKRQWDFADLRLGNGALASLDSRNSYQVSAFAMQPLSRDWMLLVSPSVEWAYADGASASDGMNYSVVAMANYGGIEHLKLGVGLAYINGVVEVKTMPFISFDWQINDRWRLSNPFEAGFNGRAGVELSYQYSDNINLGFGGGFRTDQFAYQDGAIEEELPLSFARASYQLQSGQTVSLIAGLRNAGDITVHNAGSEVDYEVDSRWLMGLMVNF
ncbi:DUF6268 family outer membrane beta-barrel protein [uncultured Ferrimonas sp.]|uniref:DUF6268 family outer membrane beta-barrel protein n=1 Tax=uncultured Ferrimonas sp. TaxID=432640 RepID=UPI002633D979|nr:DUF6268 family outer membrane beta-barrel protein [uncultured Ferrimonas sp.]